MREGVVVRLIVVCRRLCELDGSDTEPDEVVPLREVLALPKLYPRLLFELVLLLITVPRLVRTPLTVLLPFKDETALLPTRRPLTFEAEAVPTVARRPLTDEEEPDETTLPP